MKNGKDIPIKKYYKKHFRLKEKARRKFAREPIEKKIEESLMLYKCLDKFRRQNNFGNPKGEKQQ